MSCIRNEQIALFSVFFTRTSKEDYVQLTDVSSWNAFRAAAPFALREILDAPLAYADYRHVLNTLFTPGIPGSLPPVESLYKDWGGRKAGLQHGQGYYLGESALHARSVYAALGIEVPDEYRAMPDHLVLLLELNEYLRAHAPERDAADFARSHFDWLGVYQKALEARVLDEDDQVLVRGAVFYQALLGYVEDLVFDQVYLCEGEDVLEHMDNDRRRNAEEVVLQ